MFLAGVKPQKMLAEEWRRNYHTVFGRFYAYLSETRMLNKMTFMYHKIDELGKQAVVNEKMIDNVKYCFEALRDTNVEHCNVDHLKTVRRRLKSIRYPLNDNLKTLFTLIHRNLVEMCGAAQRDVPTALDAALNRETKWFLNVSMMVYQEDIENGVPSPCLKLQLFREIGASDHDTEENIMAAWARGPCRKLISTLYRLNMQSFIDFVRLSHSYSSNSADLSEKNLKSYANMVHTCEKLDLMMPQMARQAELDPSSSGAECKDDTHES